MSQYLLREAEDCPDAVFRNFMKHNLEYAARHFNLTITGQPSFGWRLRSISAPADGRQGAVWLRVISEEVKWPQSSGWTGNRDANILTGIEKPNVLDVFEWLEADWRRQRAEVMTLMPGQTCSPTDVLYSPVILPDIWWFNLPQALNRLKRCPTNRIYADQGRVTERIQERFGNCVETTVTKWTTVHGDLHWSNLMCPHFGILDWELWGTGPAGIDAATLYCYSFLVPEIAERVYALFSEQLETPTGVIAQLYAIARLLRRIEGGDYPELKKPLQDYAHQLITR